MFKITQWKGCSALTEHSTTMIQYMHSEQFQTLMEQFQTQSTVFLFYPWYGPLFPRKWFAVIFHPFLLLWRMETRPVASQRPCPSNLFCLSLLPGLLLCHWWYAPSLKGFLVTASLWCMDGHYVGLQLSGGTWRSPAIKINLPYHQDQLPWSTRVYTKEIST